MKLYSWGANNYGQLGLNFVCEQCNYPTEVLQGTELSYDNVKSIKGGGGHTLILDKSGNVFGCGLNKSYQLAFPELEHVSEFKRIAQLNNYKISEIVCGWDCSFAITEEGNVLGWGSNAFGQLGISKGKSKKIMEPIPLPLHGVVQISCGLRHTLVLLNSGKIMVTGQGRKGQLGITKDGHAVEETDFFQEVVNLDNAKLVACGQNHSLAITSDGKLFAWGDNKYGQLGCDPSVQSKTITPILINSEVIDTNNIVSLQAGWTHSVFLTENNTLINNGRNCYGQLGEEKDKRNCVWKSQFISLNKKVQQLAVGSEHNFILSDDGELWSWGWNEHGNCGLGNVTNAFTPQQIQLKNKAKLIGTGSAHCFVITEE